MARAGGVGFLAMGVLGLWEASIETLALILLAVAVALADRDPGRHLGGADARVEKVLRPILDAMQTIPAFSYLVPVVLLFSIGAATALIATVIFALPPAIRLTSLGIRSVPRRRRRGRANRSERRAADPAEGPAPPGEALDHARREPDDHDGARHGRDRRGVGVTGLGREVYNALNQLNVGEAFAGGLAIVAMAIVLDRVTYAWSEAERTRRGSKTVRNLRVDRIAPRRSWRFWLCS